MYCVGRILSNLNDISYTCIPLHMVKIKNMYISIVMPGLCLNRVYIVLLSAGYSSDVQKKRDHVKETDYSDANTEIIGKTLRETKRCRA